MTAEDKKDEVMNLECQVEYHQSRKCIYNLTLRCVRLIIVVEDQVLNIRNVCVFSP
jgi:hypothetical protein